FLIIRRPRGSTLFPYTTLFRSHQHLRPGGPVRPRGRPEHSGARLREDLRRDRKSTRLNSSHTRTSYAVFCLKKKKISTSVSTLSIIILVGVSLLVVVDVLVTI